MRNLSVRRGRLFWLRAPESPGSPRPHARFTAARPCAFTCGGAAPTAVRRCRVGFAWLAVDARLSAAAAAGRAPEATKALPVRSWPGCAQSESPAPPLRVPASAAYDIREVDLLSPSVRVALPAESLAGVPSGAAHHASRCWNTASARVVAAAPAVALRAHHIPRAQLRPCPLAFKLLSGAGVADGAASTGQDGASELDGVQTGGVSLDAARQLVVLTQHECATSSRPLVGVWLRCPGSWAASCDASSGPASPKGPRALPPWAIRALASPCALAAAIRLMACPAYPSVVTTPTSAAFLCVVFPPVAAGSGNAHGHDVSAGHMTFECQLVAPEAPAEPAARGASRSSNSFDRPAAEARAGDELQAACTPAVRVVGREMVKDGVPRTFVHADVTLTARASPRAKKAGLAPLAGGAGLPAASAAEAAEGDHDWEVSVPATYRAGESLHAAGTPQSTSTAPWSRGDSGVLGHPWSSRSRDHADGPTHAVHATDISVTSIDSDDAAAVPAPREQAGSAPHVAVVLRGDAFSSLARRLFRLTSLGWLRDAEAQDRPVGRRASHHGQGSGRAALWPPQPSLLPPPPPPPPPPPAAPHPASQSPGPPRRASPDAPRARSDTAEEDSASPVLPSDDLSLPASDGPADPAPAPDGLSSAACSGEPAACPIGASLQLSPRLADPPARRTRHPVALAVLDEGGSRPPPGITVEMLWRQNQSLQAQLDAVRRTLEALTRQPQQDRPAGALDAQAGSRSPPSRTAVPTPLPRPSLACEPFPQPGSALGPTRGRYSSSVAGGRWAAPEPQDEASGLALGPRGSRAGGGRPPSHSRTRSGGPVLSSGSFPGADDPRRSPHSFASSPSPSPARLEPAGPALAGGGAAAPAQSGAERHGTTPASSDHDSDDVREVSLRLGALDAAPGLWRSAAAGPSRFTGGIASAHRTAFASRSHQGTPSSGTAAAAPSPPSLHSEAALPSVDDPSPSEGMSHGTSTAFHPLSLRRRSATGAALSVQRADARARPPLTSKLSPLNPSDDRGSSMSPTSTQSRPAGFRRPAPASATTPPAAQPPSHERDRGADPHRAPAQQHSPQSPPVLLGGFSSSSSPTSASWRAGPSSGPVVPHPLPSAGPLAARPSASHAAQSASRPPSPAQAPPFPAPRSQRASPVETGSGAGSGPSTRASGPPQHQPRGDAAADAETARAHAAGRALTGTGSGAPDSERSSGTGSEAAQLPNVGYRGRLASANRILHDSPDRKLPSPARGTSDSMALSRVASDRGPSPSSGLASAALSPFSAQPGWAAEGSDVLRAAVAAARAAGLWTDRGANALTRAAGEQGAGRAYPPVDVFPFPTVREREGGADPEADSDSDNDDGRGGGNRPRGRGRAAPQQHLPPSRTSTVATAGRPAAPPAPAPSHAPAPGPPPAAQPPASGGFVVPVLSPIARAGPGGAAGRPVFVVPPGSGGDVGFAPSSAPPARIEPEFLWPSSAQPRAAGNIDSVDDDRRPATRGSGRDRHGHSASNGSTPLPPGALRDTDLSRLARGSGHRHPNRSQPGASALAEGSPAAASEAAAQAPAAARRSCQAGRHSSIAQPSPDDRLVALPPFPVPSQTAQAAAAPRGAAAHEFLLNGFPAPVAVGDANRLSPDSGGAASEGDFEGATSIGGAVADERRPSPDTVYRAGRRSRGMTGSSLGMRMSPPAAYSGQSVQGAAHEHPVPLRGRDEAAGCPPSLAPASTALSGRAAPHGPDIGSAWPTLARGNAAAATAAERRASSSIAEAVERRRMLLAAGRARAGSASGTAHLFRRRASEQPASRPRDRPASSTDAPIQGLLAARSSPLGADDERSASRQRGLLASSSGEANRSQHAARPDHEPLIAPSGSTGELAASGSACLEGSPPAAATEQASIRGPATARPPRLLRAEPPTGVAVPRPRMHSSATASPPSVGQTTPSAAAHSLALSAAARSHAASGHAQSVGSDASASRDVTASSPFPGLHGEADSHGVEQPLSGDECGPIGAARPGDEEDTFDFEVPTAYVPQGYESFHLARDRH